MYMAVSDDCVCARFAMRNLIISEQKKRKKNKSNLSFLI